MILLMESSISCSSIPAWAHNGGIAYCRWDGGPLEAAKAHLSNWDYFTSPGAATAMMETYSDRGLEFLKAGGFNWVWLTWSAGFSYEQEEIQQAILRPFIKKCLAAGIHCTAYLSLCNLFIRDIEMRQPQLLECLQRDAFGKVVPYAAAKYLDRPSRVLGCLNHPKWREHLRNRLTSAVEAGFEAAFYDNLSSACHCDRCGDDFKAFTRGHIGMAVEMPEAKARTSRAFQEMLPEMDASAKLDRRQLLAVYWTDLFSRTAVEMHEYAQTLRRDFMVYCNWHVYYDTLGPAQLKALSTEDGQKTSYVGPGYQFPTSPGFEVGGYASNAGLLKRMQAASGGWRPVRMQSHQPLGPAQSMEASDFAPYSAREWQRMLGECWVFRAAQEVFVEGNFMTNLFAGAADAREAWEGIGRYNRFQREHAALWKAADISESAFAVWGRENYPEPDGDSLRTRFLTALVLAGLQFDVVLNDRASAGRLLRYPLLWLPSVDVMENWELERVEAYLKQGGRVLATGTFAELEGIGRRRMVETRLAWIKRLAALGGWTYLEDRNDRGIWRGEVLIPEEILARKEGFYVKVRSLDGPVLWSAWRCPDGRRVIFLLNPDQRAPRRNVQVEMDKAAGAKATWRSPDPEKGQARTSVEKNNLECRVERLDIFGFLEITP
jgi:hypothetical protein